jgi:hypothetical protein
MQVLETARAKAMNNENNRRVSPEMDIKVTDYTLFVAEEDGQPDEDFPALTPQ